MPEGILVRQKDGVVRNVAIQQINESRFKRNNDEYESVGHFKTRSGQILHCCELATKRNNLFMRALPKPFSFLLLFGDVLFVLLNTEKHIVNFGVNDYRMLLDNTHYDISPGTIIEENSRRITKSDSIVEDDDDDEEEEEETTQENTTMGTLQTTDLSDDDDEEDTFGDDSEV